MTEEQPACARCDTDHAGLPDGSMEAKAACIAAQASKIAARASDLTIRMAADRSRDDA